jgi:methionyl-tRNA synthetase
MGHALEFVRADSIARYKKLMGYNVFFNTGTDEHGMKIYEKSKENNMDAQSFVDKNFLVFKEQLKTFGVSDDINFIRTTDKNHELGAQFFWKRVMDNGYIYKKDYIAKYCVGCESEKTDSELLDDGTCPDHPGLELQTINEENYFFKYSAFQEKLLEFYKKNPEFIIPEFRFNEIKTFVKNGLQDFSISRRKEKMPWGITVPGDSDHVMYVWFDALTNYINTLGWPDNGNNFNKYWINGTPTQYCGKDNTRFQGAMWQAMLMAADVPNSYQIVVNGHITAEGGVRMSKTLGNGVDPRDVANEYGIDALRYFLLREISSFEDSPFTLDRFKNAYNSGLANGIGNLTNRIMKMSESAFDESFVIPNMDMTPDWVPVLDAMDNFNIQEAVNIIFRHVNELDEMIQKTEPFKLIKTEPEKAKEIIKELVIKLRDIGQMLAPIMPETSRKMLEIIKENKKPVTPLFLRKD